MKEYDLVIVTNVAAFYKVNLFNLLSRKIRLKVIFISKKSKIRNDDFYNFNMKFDHAFINDKDFEERSPFKTLLGVMKEISNIKYNRMIYPGWEIKELFILSLLINKKKNSVVIESSINESNMHGVTGFLKKLYLNRMDSAYPAGFLQNKILESVGFKGRAYFTHGVGIINTQVRKTIKKDTHDDVIQPLKYVYVGRLSDEKNLILLVNVFNELNLPLVIIGTGPQEEELKSLANGNVFFKGYVHNYELSHFLYECDVFILPSISEPWGLVIDEALAVGMPVILSNKVGCHRDLVNNDNGIVFDPYDAECLKSAIYRMEHEYPKFKKGALDYRVEESNELQIKAYVESIKNT